MFTYVRNEHGSSEMQAGVISMSEIYDLESGEMDKNAPVP